MTRTALVTLLVLAVAAIPAAAEEILYLKNGSQLPVVNHWIDGDLIHVDLGGNGFMAFPRQLVERIDTDTDIRLRPSTVLSGNRGRMASSRGGGASRRDQRPQRLPLQVIDDGIETDKNGMAVRTPGRGKGRAAEQLKQYVLSGQGVPAGARQKGGYQGAEREGNHHVINPGNQKRRLVGIQQN